MEMSHILNPCYNYAVEIMHAGGMRGVRQTEKNNKELKTSITHSLIAVMMAFQEMCFY